MLVTRFNYLRLWQGLHFRVNVTGVQKVDSQVKLVEGPVIRKGNNTSVADPMLTSLLVVQSSHFPGGPSFL
jgi:hypothetical protein